MRLDRITSMSGEEFAAAFGAWYSANGASFFLCMKNTAGWFSCKPRAQLTWGRDAPGASAIIKKRLGFGTCTNTTWMTAAPWAIEGEVTGIAFNSADDVDRLYALLSGASVKLAKEVVPATVSGLPRCVGKLVKLRSLLAYSAKYRAPQKAGAGPPAPGRYTMSMNVSGTNERGWWSHASNWRHMAESLWPGIVIPDHEH